jgi:hypothetical protein
VFPSGAVCNVKPHRRYRLTGWIRTRGVDRYARLDLFSCEYGYTRGVDRYARLDLFSCEYGYANLVDLAQSPMVSGTSRWTRVEAELDSGDEAYLMPRFVLYGSGTSWFDDVALEEVG